MFRRVYKRIHNVHPDLPKYLGAILFMAICGGISENTYNNYLNDQFNLGGLARGNLELIREFPGLMIAVLMGALVFMSETKIGAMSAFITAISMVGLGLLGANWWMMLGWTLLWSTGTHLLMPINSSLTMSFGTASQRGRRLGQVGAVGIVGSIIGALIVWWVFDMMKHRAQAAQSYAPGQAQDWQFDLTFYIAAAACIGAAVCYFMIKNMGMNSGRQRLVLKKQYWLYYVLNILFGARKQVFLTFGRWVLVKVFSQPASAFAKLWIIASVLGIWFNPFVGRLIDRIGERAVLMIEAVFTVFICIGYAISRHVGLNEQGAVIMVCTCFVGDQMLMAMGMARETYLSKIVESKDDLSANLSAGVSINHLIAMTIPTLGGLLWDKHGYEIVFYLAAGLSVVQLLFSSMVKIKTAVKVAA